MTQDRILERFMENALLGKPPVALDAQSTEVPKTAP